MARLAAVTGATGFVGSRLVHRLAEAGWSVRILTRRMPTSALMPDAPLEIVLGDLADGGALRRLVAGADAVIHVAGIIKARTSAEFFAANVQGTAAMVGALDAAARNARLVHISSLAAREPGLSPYCASKHGGEEAVERIAGRQPVTILRPPAIYGPGDVEILPMFKAAAAGLCAYPGGRDGRVSLIHVDDFAAAIVRAAEAPSLPELRYEIDDGHPDGYSWPQIRAALEAALGRRIRLIRVPRPAMTGIAVLIELHRRLGGALTALCLDKVPELYHRDWAVHGPRLPGWEPRFDLAAGFQDAVRWYRAKEWLNPSR
ncbi:MAG TPA: SDR family NAD(P)-dependent oxidoreductase [Dongiaceae bacterium]|nr:SDR family NAD(P)-dependent oxidoreductase [Dongiaceae bacterium]